MRQLLRRGFYFSLVFFILSGSLLARSFHRQADFQVVQGGGEEDPYDSYGGYGSGDDENAPPPDGDYDSGNENPDSGDSYDDYGSGDDDDYSDYGGDQPGSDGQN